MHHDHAGPRFLLIMNYFKDALKIFMATPEFLNFKRGLSILSVKKAKAILFVMMIAAALVLYPSGGGAKRGLQEGIVVASQKCQSGGNLLFRLRHNCYVNSTGSNSMGSTDTTQEDPADIQSFLKWAEELAEDKEVLMAYASKDYKVLAYNCLLSLQKVGVYNAGILTLDDETVQFFLERNIAAYNVAKITKGIPEDVQLGNTVVPADLDMSRLYHPDWSTRWNHDSTVRWSHWMLRHYLALRVLKEGYGVYQTDVDMVFVNNPYDWLDPEADLEGQLQHWPAQNSLNMGIGHIAASTGGVLHWESTNNLMRYKGDNPQSIDNDLMNVLINQVGEIGESKPCLEKFPDVICTRKNSPMVNYRIWAESILPMGYDSSFVYPESGDASEIPFLGIHVHATKADYQNGKTQLNME